MIYFVVGVSLCMNVILMVVAIGFRRCWKKAERDAWDLEGRIARLERLV